MKGNSRGVRLNWFTCHAIAAAKADPVEFERGEFVFGFGVKGVGRSGLEAVSATGRIRVAAASELADSICLHFTHVLPASYSRSRRHNTQNLFVTQL